SLLTYFPYGNQRPGWDLPTANSQQSTPTNHLYTDQIKDPETDLYYYNARYYDPRIGLFISADTAGGKLNRYAYAGGNPIMYNDPTGHDSLRPGEMKEFMTDWSAMMNNACPPGSECWNQGASVSMLLILIVTSFDAAADLYEAKTGLDFVTGTSLSTPWRIFSGVSAFLPIVSGSAVRRGVSHAPDILRMATQFFEDSIKHSSRLSLYAEKFGFKLADDLHDWTKFTDNELAQAIGHEQRLSAEQLEILRTHHRQMEAHHYLWEQGQPVIEAAYDRIDALAFKRGYKQGLSWEEISDMIEKNVGNLWYTPEQKDALIEAMKNIRRLSETVFTYEELSQYTNPDVLARILNIIQKP
ncbi:hypothetical protein FJY90_01475, partial [Candidatus Gottesmanbacteria bacterium]|nr:hypothetical protein [Candidatus Gottesmanbacteria bacterium]